MDNKTRIYIIRHGESIGNVNGNFNGQNDFPLNERGIEQAIALRELVSQIKYDTVYSSPLSRAYDTCKYSINDEQVKVIIKSNLKEINGGDWEGTKWVDLPIKWPEVFLNWRRHPELVEMPNGESMTEFRNRCVTMFEEIIAENIDKTVLVYCHGTVIKVMQTYFKKQPIAEMVHLNWHDNTGVFAIDIIDENFHILMENETGHLCDHLKTKRNSHWNEVLENWLKKQEQ